MQRCLSFCPLHHWPQLSKELCREGIAILHTYTVSDHDQLMCTSTCVYIENDKKFIHTVVPVVLGPFPDVIFSVSLLSLLGSPGYFLSARSFKASWNCLKVTLRSVFLISEKQDHGQNRKFKGMQFAWGNKYTCKSEKMYNFSLDTSQVLFSNANSHHSNTQHLYIQTT